MAITIIIPTVLRQYAGGSSELAVDAGTIGEALDSLTSRHTELRKHLFGDQNALRSFVNIYINDEDIRHALLLETPVKDGDTVMIVPSIAGGISTVDEIETTELPSLSNEEIARHSRHLIMPRSAWRASAVSKPLVY